MSIIAYDTVDEAIAIANDSIYGLAASVQSQDSEKAVDIARRIRAGHVISTSKTQTTFAFHSAAGSNPAQDMSTATGEWKDSSSLNPSSEHALKHALSILK